MVTGDQPRTAEAIARAAGIAPARVLASVLPADKAARIRELQAQGRAVAMVGDGPNDAPALAQAELGLAMGSGTDVAKQAGDLTLVRGDLAAVPLALGLARRTLQVIHQNLFWAFVYNVIGLPVAAGALYVALRPGGPIGPVLAGHAQPHARLAGDGAVERVGGDVVAEAAGLRPPASLTRAVGP